MATKSRKAKGSYKFWQGGNYNRSWLMLPSNMVINNAEIKKELENDLMWERSDTGTKVMPGFRYKIIGAMAETVHKLVTNGCENFKIEKCRLQKNNFKTKTGFEVPYYNLIIDKIKTA